MQLAGGLLIAIPIAIGLAHVPDLANRSFPVYSEPTKIEYGTDPRGVKIKFEVTKRHKCQLPVKAADQDVFATLNYMDEGRPAVRAANIVREGEVQSTFKNILIVGIPSVVGPYVVEVPSALAPKLTAITINVLCDRPLLGTVYATIGPFPIEAQDTAFAAMH